MSMKSLLAISTLIVVTAAFIGYKSQSARRHADVQPPSFTPDLHTNIGWPDLLAPSPAGRILRCRLVDTVDSAKVNTPIIAVLVEDYWHDGKLILPAGTAVLGRTSGNQACERIIASGCWTLVWPSGAQLQIEGVLLDRDEYPLGNPGGSTNRLARGKEMYFYISHTIDGPPATIGNLRVTTMPAAAFAHLNTVTN